MSSKQWKNWTNVLVSILLVCLIPRSRRAAAQEATPTDDAFESANTLTEPKWQLNFLTRRMLLSICLLLLFLGFRSQPLAAQNRSADVPKTSHQQLIESYGRLPLSFEVNQGQTDAQVKFLSRRPGFFLFLTPTEAVLALHKPVEEGNPEASHGAHPVPPRKGLTNALRVRLVGANPAPRIDGLEELATKSNYFIGNDPKKWQTNVANYAKVKYVSVYPGVDVVYYGDQRQLEHDFILAPGADPRAITLGFDRREKLRIDDHGDVVVRGGIGEFRLEKPVVYQEVGGIRQRLAGGYIRKGRYQIGFRVGKYDVTKPLVIDPVLSYSTYVSPGLPSGDAMGTGIAVDSAGNAYVAGTTNSPNFPTSAGAYQTTLSSGTTLFVMKLNPAGSAVIYSTYVGNQLYTNAFPGPGIAVDSAGSAYVTGSTASSSFPTTPGAFQASLLGSANVFVTKLDPTGSELVYSTYLGGWSFDNGAAIAVDSYGSAYVTGESSSFRTDCDILNTCSLPPFPVTSGAYQTTVAQGEYACFITKLNAIGTALDYSTWLASSNSSDRGLPSTCQAIALDSSGSAYVTGYTEQRAYPTTPGAFQTGPSPASAFTAFVTKLAPDGSNLAYSTYLSGNANGSAAGGIAVDSAGSAYVTGAVGSPNASYPATRFPTTPGAFQTSFAGPAAAGDFFITKLTADGSGVIYSTYLGIRATNTFYCANNGCPSIAVDSAGSASVAGTTGPALGGSIPTTPDALQTANRVFGSNAFVSKLTTDGSGLLYSTYLGGSGYAQGLGTVVDSAGAIYVTGYAGSQDFPTTAGSAYPVYNSSITNSGFVAKFGQASTTTTLTSSLNPSLSGQTVTFTATVTSPSPGTPTGTVAFYDGATTTLGSSILSGTQVTFSTGSLSLGPHTITAIYSGDTNFMTSTSPPVIQSVVGSSVNLSIGAPGVTYGTAASATVSASAQGGTVTGNVTLSVDGGVPVSASLSNGSAAFNLGILGAGSHSLSANYPAQGSFLASTGSGSVTVSPAPLTIAASSGSMVYGGPVFSVTPSYTGFVNGDTAASLTTAPTCTTTATNTSIVGTYGSSCSGAVDSNYAFSYVGGTVTVTPATTTMTASVSPSSVTYGTPANVTVSVTSPVGTVPGYVTLSVDGAAASTMAMSNGSATFNLGILPAGNHAMTAGFAAQGNFQGSSAQAPLVVKQAPATVTANPASKTYSAADPPLTATESGFIAADAATIVLSATRAPGESAGTYAITPSATGTVLANYSVTYTPATFTINTASATVTANAASKTYGTADPALSASENGFTAADAATIALSATRAAGESAGTYTITPSATGAALTNYTVSYTPATFTINKASATVTASSTSKTYGTTDPSLMATETGFTPADAATITLSATRAAGESVGTYTITPSTAGGAVANYIVTYTPATFTINKASAAVTATAASKTYGTTDPSLTATETGFAAPDAATITLGATRAAGESAGAYTITPSATGAALANYSVTYTPATFTINKASATVTATAASKTYGTPDPSLTATETGLTPADAATITMSATRAAGESVGTYTITPSATGAALANYSVTYAPATFTILKATAMVTLGNLTQLYAGVALSPTATTVPSGLAISLAGAPDTSVGSYSVTATVNNPNYAGSASGTFAINPVLLTITATNATRVFGVANPTFTWTATGFVNGENSSVFAANPTCMTTATISSPFGTYPITCSGAVAKNYSFTYVSGTLTITSNSTGALSMGFWKNPNGQMIIKNYCNPSGGTSLMAFLTGFDPFNDDTATTCAGEATYTSGIINAATCSGSTCNAMLRAQMLATALDVYFSTPGLGGNRIGTYNGLGSKTPPLGGVAIDLSSICSMVDGSTGSNCSGTFEDARSEFGITTSYTGTTVLQLLSYANYASAINGSPVASSATGQVWYMQNKVKQTIAKDVFDNINNDIVRIASPGSITNPSF